MYMIHYVLYIFVYIKWVILCIFVFCVFGDAESSAIRLQGPPGDAQVLFGDPSDRKYLAHRTTPESEALPQKLIKLITRWLLFTYNINCTKYFL